MGLLGIVIMLQIQTSRWRSLRSSFCWGSLVVHKNNLKTGPNRLTWPVDEIESLRMTKKDFSHIIIDKGPTVELFGVGDANQLDIHAEFEISKEELETTIEANVRIQLLQYWRSCKLGHAWTMWTFCTCKSD